MSIGKVGSGQENVSHQMTMMMIIIIVRLPSPGESTYEGQ